MFQKYRSIFDTHYIKTYTSSEEKIWVGRTALIAGRAGQNLEKSHESITKFRNNTYKIKQAVCSPKGVFSWLLIKSNKILGSVT